MTATILSIGFFISAVCFAIALHLEKQETAKLREYKTLKEKEIEAEQAEYARKMREEACKAAERASRRKLVNKFLIVENHDNSTLNHEVKRLEDEGYWYDVARSQEGLLCYTNYIEIKDEAK
jgi:hypothetical protein